MPLTPTPCINGGIPELDIKGANTIPLSVACKLALILLLTSRIHLEAVRTEVPDQSPTSTDVQKSKSTVLTTPRTDMHQAWFIPQ